MGKREAISAAAAFLRPPPLRPGPPLLPHRCIFPQRIGAPLPAAGPIAAAGVREPGGRGPGGSGLRTPVVRGPGPPPQPSRRLAQPRQQQAREQERPDVVGRVGRVEAVLAEGARPCDARIVDQDVDRMAGLEERMRGAPHRSEIGNIEGHALRPRGRVAALDRAQHGPGPLLGACREHDPAAACRKGLDQRATDAGIRSGDEERPPSKIRGVHSSQRAGRRWLTAMMLPSLSLNHAVFAPPPVAMLFFILIPGMSYSSNTTPRALSAATSASTSSTCQNAWLALDVPALGV